MTVVGGSFRLGGGAAHRVVGGKCRVQNPLGSSFLGTTVENVTYIQGAPFTEGGWEERGCGTLAEGRDPC